MKKPMFFIPAILFIVFYLCISICWGKGLVDWWKAIHFIAPLLVAGVLLYKNIFWGGIVGVLPAIYLISFGRNTYTGIELPLGIIIFIHYMICSLLVYKKKIAHN